MGAGRVRRVPAKPPRGPPPRATCEIAPSLCEMARGHPGQPSVVSAPTQRGRTWPEGRAQHGKSVPTFSYPAHDEPLSASLSRCWPEKREMCRYIVSNLRTDLALTRCRQLANPSMSRPRTMTCPWCVCRPQRAALCPSCGARNRPHSRRCDILYCRRAKPRTPTTSSWWTKHAVITRRCRFATRTLGVEPVAGSAPIYTFCTVQLDIGE